MEGEPEPPPQNQRSAQAGETVSRAFCALRKERSLVKLLKPIPGSRSKDRKNRYPLELCSLAFLRQSWEGDCTERLLSVLRLVDHARDSAHRARAAALARKWGRQKHLPGLALGHRETH